MGFLGAGIVAAAGVVSWYAPRANAATTIQMWGLDPNWGGDPTACGCGACSACRSHAANKLFASASDADSGRAHVFCKCLVVPLALVDESAYNALFVDGGSRASVDRREQWVQAVLAQGPPVPSPTNGAEPANGAETGSDTPDPGGNAPGGDAIDSVVEALLGRVRVRRGAGGKRLLYVDIDAAETVTTTLAISRAKKRLAGRTVSGVRGSRTLELAIPPGVQAGRAYLRLNFQDAAGNSKLLTRGIHIPPRKRAFTRP